jgi:PAS domain-containing protein
MSDTFEKPLGGADGGLALLRVMGENSFDSILITDASTETRIIYANEAFEQL